MNRRPKPVPTQEHVVTAAANTSASMPRLPTEGQLFRAKLGAEWSRLAAHIQARFDHDPAPGETIRYEGVMTEVRCSPLGKLLAWLAWPTGALMPYEGTNVPVSIEVWTEQGHPDVFKRRVYHLPGRKPFVFRSRMRMEPDGEIIEYVGGGFGMCLQIYAQDGDLHFRDEGYFFQLGWLRIKLPMFLCPGRTSLCHADCGAEEFDVRIEIKHAWYGAMYVQHGHFWHCRVDGHDDI